MSFANQSFHDEELSNLFQRNLRLQHNPSTPDQQFFTSPQSNTQSRIYASQHYTHSNYIHQPQTPVPGTSRQGYDEDTLATILRRHSIDPSLLSPSQLSLFETAPHETKLHLLELWRTAPLTPSDTLSSGPTSVALEEDLARHRYERQQNQQRQPAPERSDSFDFGDGDADGKRDAEPYMHSGYGESSGFARRDPVFEQMGNGEQEQERRFGAWRREGAGLHWLMDGDGIGQGGAAEGEDGMEL